MLKINIIGKAKLYRTEKELQKIKKDPIGALIAIIKDKKPTVISKPNQGEIDIIIEGEER